MERIVLDDRRVKPDFLAVRNQPGNPVLPERYVVFGQRGLRACGHQAIQSDQGLLSPPMPVMTIIRPKSMMHRDV
jgi:hypothetical protein